MPFLPLIDARTQYSPVLLWRPRTHPCAALRPLRQVFLDEEREREFDGLLARQLRDADDGAEAAALGGEDAVGPVGPGGLAVPTGMDAVPTAEPLSGAAAAGDATTAVVARASHDSMQASDRLLESIAMAVEEEARWAEYADDYAAAVAAGEADASRVVATPARNARLLGLTPAAYLLRVLRGVRPADIDQVRAGGRRGDAVRVRYCDTSAASPPFLRSGPPRHGLPRRHRPPALPAPLAR